MLIKQPVSDPSPGHGVAFGPDEAAQLAELLVRTSRRLQKGSMAELGPMGLTGARARVIRHLEAAGRPVRMADIAAALEVVPRTVTSIVDDLEQAKLVTRAIDPRDRRSLLVSLTAAGERQLDRVAEARRRTAEATFSRLSKAERAELAKMLARLCECDCGASAELRPPPGSRATPPDAKRGR